MTPKQTLIKARELISDPKRWTQGVFARDKEGNKLEFGSNPQATCFCSLGALQRVDPANELAYYRTLQPGPATKSLLGEAAYKLGYPNAVTLNDSTDHETVLKMFDLAIEMAEK